MLLMSYDFLCCTLKTLTLFWFPTCCHVVFNIKVLLVKWCILTFGQEWSVEKLIYLDIASMCTSSYKSGFTVRCQIAIFHHLFPCGFRTGLLAFHKFIASLKIGDLGPVSKKNKNGSVMFLKLEEFKRDLWPGKKFLITFYFYLL